MKYTVETVALKHKEMYKKLWLIYAKLAILQKLSNKTIGPSVGKYFISPAIKQGKKIFTGESIPTSPSVILTPKQNVIKYSWINTDICESYHEQCQVSIHK